MSLAKGEALRGKTSPRHVLDVLIKERANDGPRIRHRRRHSREIQTQVVFRRIDPRSGSVLQGRATVGEDDGLGLPFAVSGETVALTSLAKGVTGRCHVMIVATIIPVPPRGAGQPDRLPDDGPMDFREVGGSGRTPDQIWKTNLIPVTREFGKRFLVMGADGVRLNSGGQGQVRKSHSASFPETRVRSQHDFTPPNVAYGAEHIGHCIP